jgi:pimeloyl-ACP methyl ester carboxylesterase
MSGRYQVRGLELAYHAWGDPDRPMILAIHGFQDHGRSFARVARLLERDWHVVAPDLRGHGESGWVGAGGDYYIYDYVFDVLKLLDHLGVDRFKVIAHSMGGNVASYLGALIGARVDAMILLEGLGYQEQDLAETVSRLQRWSNALRRSGIDLDLDGRRRSRVAMKDLDEAADRLMRYNPRLLRDHALELAETFTEDAFDGRGRVWRFDPLHKVPSARGYLVAETEAAWRTLLMPVLSLFGSESPWAPPDLAARAACVRSIRSAIVQGAGHNIHHDMPQVLASVADAFFRDPGCPLPSGVSPGLPAADP